MNKRIDPLISVEEIRRTTVRFQQHDRSLEVAKDGEMISVTMNSGDTDYCMAMDMTPIQLGNFIDAIAPLAVFQKPKEAVSFTMQEAAQIQPPKRRVKPGQERLCCHWSEEELMKAGSLLTQGAGYQGAAFGVKRSVKAVRQRHSKGKLIGAPPYAPSEIGSLRGRIANLHKQDQKAAKQTQ